MSARPNFPEDPHRPRCHFLPPANWMNDPNGLIQWEGQYHLFYQYNPAEPVWGTMHWGHAVSDDLVHWRDLPIALAPTPGSLDEAGCWSGCAVDHEGIPTLIYTGLKQNRESVCLASSTDGLITWVKKEIVAAPPDDLGPLLGFRDPYVWREDSTWYMLIGTGVQNVGGAVLLYRSADLVHWEYMHPLLTGKAAESGAMWECPQFFRLGDKHVLVVSAIVHAYAMYFVGTYEEHTFTPESQGLLDLGLFSDGAYFFAPATMRDDQGRRLMWGWVREGRGEANQKAAGWAGVQSVPRVLSLQAGELTIKPAPELAALRGDRRQFGPMEIAPTETGLLEGVQGDCLEIRATFAPGADAERFGIEVRCSPSGEEHTAIFYERGYLGVDCDYASLDDAVYQGVLGDRMPLEEDEPLELHILLDRSVLEVFANGRACITARIYPSREDSLGVRLFARGGSASLETMDVWPMKSIW